MFKFVLLLLLVLPGFIHAQVKVVVAENLDSVEVHFPAGAGKLEAPGAEIWDQLEVVANATIGRRQLVPIDPQAPVVYRVRLTHSSSQWMIAQLHPSLRLSDWTDWLLTPESWSMSRPFELSVSVPEKGIAVLPFQLMSEKPGESVYKAYPILPDHGGLALFGKVQRRQLTFGQSELSAVVVGDDTGRYFDWIKAVAQSAVDVHGTAPGERSLVVVVPIPYLSSAVPWAHVRRGGGSHIIAYVNQGAKSDELLEDWTLFHEMAHLYHPYLQGSGRWVSEGFASYFQNVYRARGNFVEPDHAYQRLMAGMQRGRKENEQAGNRPVTQGGRMRTYWTGAALAFEADGILMNQPDQSLAMAMGRFAKKYMPVSQTWHPRDYLIALDKELKEPVLGTLYDSYIGDRYFPDPEVSESIRYTIFTGE